MRNSRLWARMLAAGSGTVIEGISWEENPGPDGEPEITVIARVRPLEAYRFRRHLYYATSAILVSIPSSYSEGVRYPSPF